MMWARAERRENLVGTEARTGNKRHGIRRRSYSKGNPSPSIDPRCYALEVRDRRSPIWVWNLGALVLAFEILAGAGPPKSAARIGVLGFARDAPDRVLLSSNETGVFQLYSLELGTGRKRQITSIAVGKTSGTISPDGRWIYFLLDTGGSELGRYVRAPFEGGASMEVDPGSPPSSGLGISNDQSGKFLVEGLSSQEQFRFQRIEKGKHPLTLYRSGHEAYGPALSADGRYLAIVETERKNDRHYATLLLDARTGERLSEIWDGGGINVTHGPWSPKPGDERIVLHSDRSGFFRPAIFDLKKRTRTELPVDLAGDVTGEDWTPDGRGVLLRQRRSGRDALFVFELAAGRLASIPLPPGTVGACWDRPDGKVWAQVQSSTTSPRLIEIDRASGTSRTLISSAEFRAAAPLELVSFTGAMGDPISAYLGVPKPAARNGAAIVWIHGGPHSEVADTLSSSLQAYVEAGFAVLAPNYHGSSGEGRAFASSIEGNPMALELEDFSASRKFLLDRGFAPTGLVFAAGWSYGGFAVLSCLTRQPGDWAGGSAGAAIADWRMQFEDARGPLRGWTMSLFGGSPAEKPDLYRDRSPIERAGAIRAPLLIFQGKNDRRTSARQIEELLRKLDEGNKRYEVHWYDAGHSSLSADEQALHVRKTIEFFRGIVDRGSSTSVPAQ